MTQEDKIQKARDARIEAVRLWKVHDAAPFGHMKREVTFAQAARAARKATKLEKALGIDPKTGILSSTEVD